MRYMPYIKNIDNGSIKKCKKNLKRIVGDSYVDSYEFMAIGNR